MKQIHLVARLSKLFHLSSLFSLSILSCHSHRRRAMLPTLACILGLMTTPAWSVDGVIVQGGSSQGQTDSTRYLAVGAQWNWLAARPLVAGLYGGAYLESTLAEWSTAGVAGGHRVIDVGVTPVFRLQGAPDGRPTIYAELAVGAHLLSNLHIADSLRFSTAFQFGDHGALGMRLGERGQWDLGYRFQHLSNARLKQPNPGINFHQVRLMYSFAP